MFGFQYTGTQQEPFSDRERESDKNDIALTEQSMKLFERGIKVYKLYDVLTFKSHLCVAEHLAPGNMKHFHEMHEKQ